MRDEDKAKGQLINELAELRQRFAELKILEAERKQAEQALLESEHKYRSLFESMLNSFAYCKILVDENNQPIDYVHLEVNDAWERAVGLKRKDVIGKKITEVIPGIKESKPDLISIYGKVALTGEATRFELYFEPLGKWFTVSVYSPKKGYFVAVFENITERKQAEEALRESEERYRRLVALSPDTIAVHSEGKIVFINPAGVKLLRAENAEQLVGKPIMDLLHPDYRGKVKERITKAGQGSTSAPFIEEKFIRLDGTTVDVEVAAVPFTYQGKPAMQAVARDITERKQAEEVLWESEERHRAICEQAADSIVLVDAESGELVDFNDRAYENLGYNREEFEKLTIPDFEVIESLEEVAKHIEKIIKEGSDVFETQHRTKGGEIRDVQVSSRSICIGGRNFVQSVWRDITEHKRAGEVLRESEENFRHSLDSSPLGIRIINAKGETIYANWAILDIYGYSSIEEFKSIPAVERHTLKSYAERQERVSKREAGEPVPDRFEQSIIRKNGEVRNLEVFNREVLWGGEKQFQLIYHDITERKQTEEALRESEERYRSLLKLGGEVGEAIIMLQDNEQGDPIQTFVSDVWPRITGYSKKELLGMSFSDLLHPKYRDASLKRHRRKMKGEIIPGLFEMSIMRKDGIEVLIELTSAYTTYKGERAIVAYIRDITERKRAEEREKELQKELNLASRLASVGKLAAGVAHEINNPLTGVLAFSERLLRKSTDEKVSRDLKRINDEAGRAAKVVERLLTFARRREPEKESLNINSVVRKALELRAYELKTSNIKVELDLAVGLPKVMVDSHQFQEVFLSIIMNAEQAMTEADRGGKLGIKTQPMKDCIRISFTDDGPGIPAEQLDKIFDPFFTTRGKEGGTGLGLSVCYGIVERHDGRIYARSKPGKGVTFIVELPLTGEKVKEAKQS